jgi:hypothetical protein
VGGLTMPMQTIKAMCRKWMSQLSEWRDRELKGANEARESRFAQTSAISEGEKLLVQLREAHVEWMCAQKRLDYVLGDDEVDYAIFALETAEKRYGMLLKQAKQMNVSGHGVYGHSLQWPVGEGRTLSG